MQKGRIPDFTHGYDKIPEDYFNYNKILNIGKYKKKIWKYANRKGSL